MAAKHHKASKKKMLSIIYFLDASKTRSFQLSLTTVKVLFTCLSLLFMWAFCSAYFSYQLYAERDVIEERLNASLATIFEYQSRYDGVYEYAYPNVVEKNEDIMIAQDGQSTEHTVSSDFKEKNPDNKALEIENISEDLQPRFGNIEKLTAVAKDKTWPITVRDLNFHQENNEIELSFTIKNENSPTKVDGNIWGVVELRNTEKEAIFVASSKALKLDAQGKVINPDEGANRYSIRFNKAKSFYFYLPKDFVGSIEKATIYMTDKVGGSTEANVQLGAFVGKDVLKMAGKIKKQ